MFTRGPACFSGECHAGVVFVKSPINPPQSAVLENLVFPRLPSAPLCCGRYHSEREKRKKTDTLSLLPTHLVGTWMDKKKKSTFSLQEGRQFRRKYFKCLFEWKSSQRFHVSIDCSKNFLETLAFAYINLMFSRDPQIKVVLDFIAITKKKGDNYYLW